MSIIRIKLTVIVGLTPADRPTAAAPMAFISSIVFSALMATIVASPNLNLSQAQDDRCRYKRGIISTDSLESILKP